MKIYMSNNIATWGVVYDLPLCTGRNVVLYGCSAASIFNYPETALFIAQPREWRKNQLSRFRVSCPSK